MNANWAVTGVVMLGAVLGLSAEPEPASEAASQKTKEETIRELLAITNAAQMADKIAASRVDSYRRGMTAVPAAFWDELGRDLKRDVNQFVEQLIPVYDRHFTMEEIRELIAFYHTPVGRKLLEEQMSILQESIAIGESWGRGVSEKIRKRLEAKKYVK